MIYLPQHTLNIDLETWSTFDIKLGVHKYHSDSEVVLFASSFDRAPVEVVDILQGEELPDLIVDAVFDKRVIKKAWNAAFEIEALERFFMTDLDLNQWRCTMVKAARCGYPLSLDEASKAIGMGVEKDARGKALIKFFCVPRKPTKARPETRNYPKDDPAKWQEFIEYARRDVEAEVAIDKYLDAYPDQPEFEDKMYILDRQINKRGLELDIPFIKKAVQIDAEYKKILLEEAKQLTGLDNPNSVDQLKVWFGERNLQIDSLNKETLKSYTKLAEETCEDPLMSDISNPEEVLAMLKLRKELSNTSVRKYVTMLKANINGRIYDTIQFNGAGRTGRNAGRIIQPQNLPRVYMDDDELDVARSLVANGDLNTLIMCYGDVSSVLSQLIRTAIVAKKGKTLMVADLSAIEARVLAWFADEEDDLAVFRTHGKIYEATAAMMFKVPFESITKGSPMRQRGKVASLACGYQGGPNAITQMDTDNAIPDAEKPGLVKAWRDSHPKTVRLWYKAQSCAIEAIKNPGNKVPLAKGAYFITHKDALLFYLPSGRYLMYPKVFLGEGKYGDEIRFMGLDQTTNKWKVQSTYGGKLIENLVQAFARDVLMQGMYNMVKKGYHTVTNVHDEAVNEEKPGFGSLEEMYELMCTMPSWADGLPLAADGFKSDYYKK